MQKVKVKAAAIRHILIVRGIQQKDFAQSIGISASHFSHLLSGQRGPSANIRRKMIGRLKSDFDTLFEIEEVYS